MSDKNNEKTPSSSILRQLQNYKWNQTTITDLIHYFKTKELPKWVRTTRQEKRFYEKYQGFAVIKGCLVYVPLGLQVVPEDDTKKCQKILEKVYRLPEALGKGQNNFYGSVVSRFLGIKRKVVVDFLKGKPEYQMLQDKPKIVSKGIQATAPFQYWAIDLVDMSYYDNVRANKKYRYIFSCIDVFTKYAWFQAIKTKDAPSTLEAFKKIIASNLVFKPTVERKQFDYPRIIVSDNGAEFKGELDGFFKEHGIKHITTNSYVPQPNIENLNGQLRHMIRDNFIRTNSLAWYPYLQSFALSKNTNKDQTTRQTPMSLMSSYFEQDHPQIEKIANKIRKTKEQHFERFYKQEDFAVGDLVRVKMTSIQSALRKKVKEGTKKLIVVRFSPAVYRITRIQPVARGKVGFPIYFLEDMEGNPVRNASGKSLKRFNSGELLKIGANTPLTHPIDLERANFLNRVRAEDLNVQRETSPAETPVEESIEEPKTKEPKSVSKWGSKDWTIALKGKSFDDFDKLPATILKVVYSRVYREYIVDYRVDGQSQINQATLGDILELGFNLNGSDKSIYISGI